MVIYSIFVNFQEYISRGILQSSLQDFLNYKHKNLFANLLTSSIFSASHIHLSAGLAYLVFLPSLFWGWLYYRQRSLIGPIVSHILIGWWAIFVLGIEGLFR
jgi:membrane protease YdiL (CAAX protease family)